MRILIICTGNTCRSQMAEGFLKSFDKQLEVYSAGTQAEGKVNQYAVKVMDELNIDISRNLPQHVDLYLNKNFDFVITVCDGAKESCPVFRGKVKKHVHIGFEDPAKARGTEEEQLLIYRKVRDQIKKSFSGFYQENIQMN